MNVTIIGLGLIGGSLGLALQATSLDLQVSGWDRDPATVAMARDRGVIERGFDTLAEAVVGADLVVVATPVLAVRAVFEQIAPHLGPGTIVSDVASTKVQVLEWAQLLLPPTVAFVGGHPMAGSEQHGIGQARADLFRGAIYCLTPLPGVPVEVVTQLEQLTEALGARPLRVEAATHDAFVAAVSHLPFMLSAALVQHVGNDERWPDMRRLAATGFRDVTRLASGDPAMHRDICLTNSAMIRAELRGLARLLNELADHLDDPGYLETFFAAALAHRGDWLRERSQ